VPGVAGKVGMAALVADRALDLKALRAHLAQCLPAYACPVFLRMCPQVELTGTFKYSKTELVRQAYYPAASSDALYFDSPEDSAFVSLDESRFERIQRGEFRL
jgi:fatty-acyl-CoA synthase